MLFLPEEWIGLVVLSGGLARSSLGQGNEGLPRKGCAKSAPACEAHRFGIAIRDVDNLARPALNHHWKSSSLR